MTGWKSIKWLPTKHSGEKSMMDFFLEALNGMLLPTQESEIQDSHGNNLRVLSTYGGGTSIDPQQLYLSEDVQDFIAAVAPHEGALKVK